MGMLRPEGRGLYLKDLREQVTGRRKLALVHKGGCQVVHGDERVWVVCAGYADPRLEDLLLEATGTREVALLADRSDVREEIEEFVKHAETKSIRVKLLKLPEPDAVAAH